MANGSEGLPDTLAVYGAGLTTLAFEQNISAILVIHQKSSDGSSHHLKHYTKEDHPSIRATPPTDLDQISVHARGISFHHPGYAHPNDIFPTLLAPDHSSGGLHHLTALTACGIVAGNRFDGYFSTVPNGKAIEDSPDSVLKGHDYWFHVPQSSTDTMNAVPLTPYPIYTSFEQWQFPHGSFPTSWLALQNEQSEPALRLFAESSLNTATIFRDHTCRITGSQEATDVAHVIPRSVNDLSNTILLRADLHRTFDALKWAIIPKPNSENVLQFVFDLTQYLPELATRYHNSCVRDIAGVSPQLLFAAFAQAIFSSVLEFLRKDVGRWLLAISSQSHKYESRYYAGHNVIRPLG
ncbi:hypothetical protein MMC31_002608 [Peltigera leucophlebia]|nr:hypothetical protein [Peltigera leucophlebia]